MRVVQIFILKFNILGRSSVFSPLLLCTISLLSPCFFLVCATFSVMFHDCCLFPFSPFPSDKKVIRPSQSRYQHCLLEEQMLLDMVPVEIGRCGLHLHFNIG